MSTEANTAGNKSPQKCKAKLHNNAKLNGFHTSNNRHIMSNGLSKRTNRSTNTSNNMELIIPR